MYEQEKQAAARAYEAQAAQGYAGREVPAPKEPTISSRLKETLGYLYELAEHQNGIRLAIAGPEPTNIPADIGGLKNPNEPSIEMLLADVCQRAAMLVSEARSIRNRL